VFIAMVVAAATAGAIAAENSMGLHAPQEAARVLGEAIDHADKVRSPR
jgi:formate-dependent nitrite reductase cytochrome c552 subunit